MTLDRASITGMSLDHLCFSEEEGFCVECARLEVIREDERYRVVEQIMANCPSNGTRYRSACERLVA